VHPYGHQLFHQCIHGELSPEPEVAPVRQRHRPDRGPSRDWPVGQEGKEPGLGAHDLSERHRRTWALSAATARLPPRQRKTTAPTSMASEVVAQGTLIVVR